MSDEQTPLREEALTEVLSGALSRSWKGIGVTPRIDTDLAIGNIRAALAAYIGHGRMAADGTIVHPRQVGWQWVDDGSADGGVITIPPALDTHGDTRWKPVFRLDQGDAT